MTAITKTQQHIHFIGICGVAMSALAIAFHKRGYKVTGSDKGFYPPVSTNLEAAGISFYPGWHPEKMGTPDLVVVGNVAGTNNPEWLHVQSNNLEYKSYPEVIRDFFIAEHSIVCAGTYGKTTSTTILSWVLSEAGLTPNYMFGGISGSDALAPAMLAEHTRYSVVEGDEYKASKWDERAKFFYYSPTHLMLTAVKWDHADVYPTEQSYIDAFQELVLELPNTGTLVMSDKVTNIKKLPEATILRYGRSESADYRHDDVQVSRAGISFHIFHGHEKYAIKSTMLGEYSADNLTGCFAMAHTLGIAPEIIIQAFASFGGIKRRLERRHIGTIDVYDDIAHSPSKAEATLNSLRALYSGKLIAVYEPNTGNRATASFPGYAHAFRAADEVIIPRLTAVKIAQGDTDPPVDGEVLTEVIRKTHDHVTYIPEDDTLVTHLLEHTAPGDCIVFLGSHGFRHMIEDVVTKLS
jgi:UDP-N-acetylmuramate: L-alanyl-gamma-D-glutamyl-meso-diaminopimelate ligase